MSQQQNNQSKIFCIGELYKYLYQHIAHGEKEITYLWRINFHKSNSCSDGGASTKKKPLPAGLKWCVGVQLVGMDGELAFVNNKGISWRPWEAGC